MKIKTSILTIAGVLTFSSAAFAQADQAAPAAPPAASTSVSPDEVQKFASAAIALNKIQADASTAAPDKQPKMMAAVQQSGLTPQRFNEIAQAADKDPALQQQIQAAASSTQSPQPQN